MKDHLPNPAKLKKAIGSVIKEKRVERNLSLGELAELSGKRISKSTLWGMESGNQNLTLTQFLLLASILETDAGELVNTIWRLLDPQTGVKFHGISKTKKKIFFEQSR